MDVKGEASPDGTEERILSRTVLDRYLGLTKEAASPVHYKRLSGCMKRLGWSFERALRTSESMSGGYYRSIKPVFAEDAESGETIH